MEAWVRAIELLNDSEKRSWLEQKYVGYIPTKGKFIAPSTLTGDKSGRTKNDQIAETEFDLGWHITLSPKGKILLISHEATEFELALCWKSGWENYMVLLENLKEQCYGNSTLGTVPIRFDLKTHQSLSLRLKRTALRAYWLEEKNVKSLINDKIFFEYHAMGGKIKQGTFYRTDIYPSSLAFSIRPLFSLPDDLLICIGSEKYSGSKERPLQIKRDTESKNYRENGNQGQEIPIGGLDDTKKTAIIQEAIRLLEDTQGEIKELAARTDSTLKILKFLLNY